ncbi:Flp pilus assembly protein CpaB [Geodermatophilus sp. URMC 62]|uniref:Flp pilus assembly protein CpaB n=1 Tax=Geodermatophilus sp. URMC 62 TaxID=3423414 RepID=UPI00406CFC3D
MRRLLAAVAALLLALVGTVVLVAYVRGADARALEGVQTVPVLVVDRPIAAGTPADQLDGLVRTELLPARAAVEGRVEDLAQLAGRVADVDLQPGEQLLAGRFVAPEELTAPGTVPPPAGAAEVSILLEPQRAVGGRLAAGDTVGVHVSLAEPAATHLVLDRVLVTQVQGAPAPAADGEGAEAAASGGGAPTASLLVTLGLPPAQAETVVFGMEHGTVWLSLEPADVDPSGTEVVTPDTLYAKDPS